jgi:hypothetical protein
VKVDRWALHGLEHVMVEGRRQGGIARRASCTGAASTNASRRDGSVQGWPADWANSVRRD